MPFRLSAFLFGSLSICVGCELISWGAFDTLGAVLNLIASEYGSKQNLKGGNKNGTGKDQSPS